MLEFAEEALNQVALAINPPIDRAMHQALAGRRNVSLCAARPDQIEKGICVITTVGNDMAAFKALKQMRRRAQIVCLAGGQHEPDG